MVYYPGEGGWGGKTIRTKRDKSVVNSIKVLMFARSANTHTHNAYTGPAVLYNRLRPPPAITVICQVSFRTGRRWRRRSCSRIFFFCLFRPTSKLKTDHYLVYIYEIGSGP